MFLVEAHITQRRETMPDLVVISERYNIPAGNEVLPRPSYVEVITRKTKKGKQVRPEQRLCDHLSPAIYADGIDKGRLVKVCVDKSCSIHFHEQQQLEKQEAKWRAERAAAKRKEKQTLSLRHRLLSEVLKRLKPSFGCEELRIVGRFVLQCLSHDLACRLAKRHALANPKNAHDWDAAEKARNLYRKADAAELAALIFEAMLVGPAGDATLQREDDLLADSARLCKIEVKRLRTAVAKDEKAKAQKKTGEARSKSKSAPSNRRQSRQGPASRDAGPRRRYFSRDGSLRSGDLSPTMHMATPVTRPTISAWAG
jgi:hypothetical protein